MYSKLTSVCHCLYFTAHPTVMSLPIQIYSNR